MSERLHDQRGVSQDIAGLPVDRGVLFSDQKNIYRRGIEKRQTRLIKQISFIKPFLKDDEKILLVTTGCSPLSFLEQFLTGWIVFYLKRSLFVFTNNRLFHIPTKANYTYRNSIARILYPDCQTIEMKGRALVIQYKSGKKEKFYYIARKEKKKIMALLKTISPEGMPSKSPGRVHLCPRCAEELVEDKYLCQRCRLEFKNRTAGKRISILYPGGGYFYTGHWWLGVGDAITEAVLLVLVVIAFIDTLQGGKEGISSLVFFSILLAIEKALSVYHLHHFVEEYIPLEKNITPAVEVK